MFSKKVFPIVLVANLLLLNVQSSPIGSWFAITNLSYDQVYADIAYNSQRQEYLTVWWEDRPDATSVWGPN
jgi:hypothetical protein